MDLIEKDIIKFYELYSRLNLTSPNIGVVGEKRRFIELIKNIQKKYKKSKTAKIMINSNRTKITVLDKEIETSYIYIQNLYDLRGYHFRKYI